MKRISLSPDWFQGTTLGVNDIGTFGWPSKSETLRQVIKRSESDGVACKNHPVTLAMGA